MRRCDAAALGDPGAHIGNLLQNIVAFLRLAQQFLAEGFDVVPQPRVMRRDDRIWRGDDGRYRCKRSDGTTGLIIGAGVGALLGRSLDGGRDKTTGTVLGAAGGALLGRAIDRGEVHCK